MAEEEKRQQRPPQRQERQPGIEAKMTPPPQSKERHYRGSGKLLGKAALITGGDSGIGRAVAIAFAKEGADVAIGYLSEHQDAEETRRLIEKEGRRCITIAGDIGEESFCRQMVGQTIEAFGQLDIVVNNAAEQHPQEGLEQISAEQLERTFRTNVFSFFYVTKAALPHLREGSAVINTASVTAYKGSPHLLDYSATKGAIVAFTRSLSQSLIERGIRVNGVAPGPIWTPLIPAEAKSAEQVAEFGGNVPMGRAGEPDEVAPTYVFLASEDASYYAGQVLHPNGGVVVNG
ncbi:MAG: SDR family oxidoreductase [Nitrospirae bacterium]|nr:SDR family oxidoreductase [Candidatus Manganitrophaceae bacterium]